MDKTVKIFSQEWLKKMEDRARKCKTEEGGPEVLTGYYAARKVKGVWKFSNGRNWWENPAVVREFHEYADGTVTAHCYIEGLQMFKRRSIDSAGMRPVRPAELPDLLPLAKIVYFDHGKLDEKGKATRLEKRLEKQPEKKGE